MASREKARRIIRDHYGLKRRVTDAEIDAEKINLRRRGLDRLDDNQAALAAKLNVFENRSEP